MRFEAAAARWVKHENWHPKQEGKMLSDGRYQLKLPFGDTTELVREILKYGANVEVVSPATLRAEIAQHLTNALKKYQQ